MTRITIDFPIEKAECVINWEGGVLTARSDLGLDENLKSGTNRRQQVLHKALSSLPRLHVQSTANPQPL